MGHGGGGQLSAELVEHLFLPAFSGMVDDAALGSSATPPSSTSAARAWPSRTDSYVVRPLLLPRRQHRRPRGERHRQRPRDERRPPDRAVGRLHPRGGPAHRRAGRHRRGHGARQRGAPGCPIVTGDTKVVDGATATASTSTPQASAWSRPASTSGRIASAPATPSSCPVRSACTASPCMSVREGLEFGSDIVTDSAPLNGLVASLLDAGIDVHVLRDPTRGGVAATLNEIAKSSAYGHADRRARRAGARRRARGLRASSASTRSTSPTRAGSSPSSGPMMRSAPWRRCVPTSSRQEPRSSGTSSQSILGSSWPGPASAAPAWSTSRWPSSSPASAEPLRPWSVRLAG